MKRVILLGEIGSDIVLKKTATGQSLCNFSIEVKEKGKNGQEHKYFFDCTAWGENAEHINQYGFRGQHIAVGGKLQKSSYTNNSGQKVYKKSVYVMDVELNVNNATNTSLSNKSTTDATTNAAATNSTIYKSSKLQIIS